MRDIKRRRTSVQSTQQITKAMKLVSTVKLQKARTRAEESKPYFDCMYATMTSLLANGENWADHLKNFIGKRILKREIKKEQKRKEV